MSLPTIDTPARGVIALLHLVDDRPCILHELFLLRMIDRIFTHAYRENAMSDEIQNPATEADSSAFWAYGVSSDDQMVLGVTNLPFLKVGGPSIPQCQETVGRMARYSVGPEGSLR